MDRHKGRPTADRLLTRRSRRAKGYRTPDAELHGRDPVCHTGLLEWDDCGVADWPAWATARVEVRPADPRWQRLGDGLRCELDLALARWLIAPVEPVGSTAVPGLAAKPVLDLQAAVADLGSRVRLPRR